MSRLRTDRDENTRPYRRKDWTWLLGVMVVPGLIAAAVGGLWRAFT